MTRAGRSASRAARIGAYARRIVRSFSAARSWQYDGAYWYQTARGEAEHIAESTGVPVARVIAVIAVLSPRVTWSINVRAARTLCYAYASGEPEPVVAGTRRNRSKAWSILQGAAIETALGPSAPKVRAFYANLSGDWSRVTVDVWATRVATGRENVLPRPTTYGIFERAYQNAARKLGVSAAVVQATVWVALRDRTNAPLGWEAIGPAHYVKA